MIWTMKKLLVFLSISLISILSQNSFADQETLTLTVYYPAPYGIYNDLRAKKMAIGDTYYDPNTTTIPAGTSLIVEGNVGIDTKPASGPIVTPPFKLTLGEVGVRNGGILATGIYSGTISDIWPDFAGGLQGPFFIWYPEKAAFRVGYKGDYNPADPIGNRWILENIGFNSIAMGHEAGAVGDNSVAIGQYNFAWGDSSLALGRLSEARSNASISIGHDVMVARDATNAIVIGAGATGPSSGPLVNDVPNSLMVGFQCDAFCNTPTFFVDTSFGSGTTGSVGIGTKTPGHQLTITRNLELPISTATTGIIYMADNSTSPATEYKFIRAPGNNTFVGINSGLNANEAAVRNTAAGHAALSGGVSGNDNTAVGYGALNANTSGYNNTAVGTEALGYNTIGHNNTAIGMYALLDNVSGNYNTAIGLQTLGGVVNRTSTASNNTAVGGWALEFITTGSNNVAIGTQAGGGTDKDADPGITEGFGNVFIGYNAGMSLPYNTSNRLYIANQRYDPAHGYNTPPLIYGEFDNRRIAVNTTDTSGWAFKVQAPSGEGHVKADGNWSTCSDLRLKKNITTLQDSLYKLSKVRGVNFDFKSEPASKKGKGKHIGFIAQELEKEFPELVDTDTNGYKSVSYANMTPVLVEAVKELKAKNDALEKNIQQRAEKIKALEEVLNKKAGK
jgi:hypothetical protein